MAEVRPAYEPALGLHDRWVFLYRFAASGDGCHPSRRGPLLTDCVGANTSGGGKLPSCSKAIPQLRFEGGLVLVACLTGLGGCLLRRFARVPVPCRVLVGSLGRWQPVFGTWCW